MTDGFIWVDIEDSLVADYLSELERESCNMSQVWGVIAQIVYQSVMKNFVQKRSPSGEPWQRVSFRYAQHKESMGFDPNNILILSGLLQSSIYTKSSEEDLEIGSDVVYAAVHQFGDSDCGDIPARPYLGVRIEDWWLIRMALMDFLHYQRMKRLGY